jgi:hypothetical protein
MGVQRLDKFVDPARQGDASERVGRLRRSTHQSSRYGSLAGRAIGFFGARTDCWRRRNRAPWPHLIQTPLTLLLR